MAPSAPTRGCGLGRYVDNKNRTCPCGRISNFGTAFGFPEPAGQKPPIPSRFFRIEGGVENPRRIWMRKYCLPSERFCRTSGSKSQGRNLSVEISGSVHMDPVFFAPKTHTIGAWPRDERALQKTRKRAGPDAPSEGVFGAALYCRVSTASQSHRSQLKALREFCAQKGWDVLVEVRGVASGASVRPARDALIRAARQKED